MKRFFKSFQYAFAGIRTFFSTERNAQVHLFMAVIVVCAAFYFDVSFVEWVTLLLCIVMVLCAEMINTAIEHLCNSITTEIKPAIKTVKDISAGAVLIASVMAAIIGVMVFLPYVSDLFG